MLGLPASAYTMVAISIDKYLAIMYPMRLRMPKIQAKIIILVIWSAALLTSLPTALVSSLEPASSDYSSASPSAAPTSATTLSSLHSSDSSPALAPTSAPTFVITNHQTSEWAARTSSAMPYPQNLVDGTPKSDPSDTSTTTTSAITTSQEQQQIYQEQRKYFCQESWSFWPRGKYFYSMALMILQFVLPLFVLVITYSRIVIVVWGKRMPGEEDNARDARMARSKRKVNRARSVLPYWNGHIQLAYGNPTGRRPAHFCLRFHAVGRRAELI